VCLEGVCGGVIPLVVHLREGATGKSSPECGDWRDHDSWAIRVDMRGNLVRGSLAPMFVGLGAAAVPLANVLGTQASWARSLRVALVSSFLSRGELYQMEAVLRVWRNERMPWVWARVPPGAVGAIAGVCIGRARDQALINPRAFVMWSNRMLSDAIQWHMMLLCRQGREWHVPLTPLAALVVRLREAGRSDAVDGWLRPGGG